MRQRRKRTGLERLARADKDFALLEALGYAARLPLGRQHHYSSALLRRAVRVYIWWLRDDPVVGADVRAALEDPETWYRAAFKARLSKALSKAKKA